MRAELVVQVREMSVVSVESQGLRGEKRMDAVGQDVVVGESDLVRAEIGVNAPEIEVMAAEIEVGDAEIGVMRSEIEVITPESGLAAPDAVLIALEIGVHDGESGVVRKEIRVTRLERDGEDVALAVLVSEMSAISEDLGVVRVEIGVISAEKRPGTCHPVGDLTARTSPAALPVRFRGWQARGVPPSSSGERDPPSGVGRARHGQTCRRSGRRFGTDRDAIRSSVGRR